MPHPHDSLDLPGRAPTLDISQSILRGIQGQGGQAAPQAPPQAASALGGTGPSFLGAIPANIPEAQKASFLQRFGMGMSGSGPQLLQNFQQRDLKRRETAQKLNKDRLTALAKDNRATTRFLQNGDIQSALDLGRNRVKDIIALGGDPGHTMQRLQLVESGQIDEAIRQGLVVDAQSVSGGFIDPLERFETVTRGGITVQRSRTTGLESVSPRAKKAATTQLGKLQRERTRLESLLGRETDTGRREKIQRAINETQAGITKATRITGTTEFDPSSRLKASDQSKRLAELDEKRIGVEQFHDLAQFTIKELDKSQDASTVVSTLTKFGVNVLAEARAAARVFDIDISAVNLDPDKFTGGFGKLAGANRAIKTAGLSLALSLAVAAGITGKNLNDNDIRRFLDQTGLGESDPRLIVQNLKQLDLRNQENFRIRQSIIDPDTEFTGFGFELPPVSSGFSDPAKQKRLEALRAKRKAAGG